jgi:hypothetical protein
MGAKSGKPSSISGISFSGDVASCGSNSPLAGHRGAKGGGELASHCNRREGKGNQFLSSSMRLAAAPSQFSADKAASLQPPHRSLDPAVPQVLEPSPLRSNSFPTVKRGAVVAVSRRKGAPEQLAPAPRRHRMEDAGKW